MTDYNEKLDRLLEIYLRWYTGTDRLAGWSGDSSIAQWMDFCGDPPPGLGYDQADAKMIRSIERLQKMHALVPEIRAQLARLTELQRRALLYHAHYVGTVDRQTGQRITGNRVAALLEVSPGAFRQAVHRARLQLLAWLEGEKKAA